MAIKNFFFKELKRQYSFRFIRSLIVLVGFIFTPVLILSNRIKFDPAEFVNLYLSTIFTSIFIAIILQILELYRTVNLSHKKALNHIELIEIILNNIKLELADNHSHLKSSCELLLHYKNSILNNLVNDSVINENLVLLYSKSEFKYINEVLKNNEKLAQVEIAELEKHINFILIETNSIKVLLK